MSIRANGGVFGRNPYFNTVSIAALLSANGGASVTGGPLVVTDQTVTFQGSGSSFSRFFFDPVTQRVGIGLTNPTRKLEVFDPSSGLVAQFRSNQATSAIALANSASSADAIRIGSTGNDLVLSTTFLARVTVAGGAGSTGNVTVNTGDLIIGTAGKGLKHGASGPLWTSGAGSPEGVVTAPPGSLYTNTSGGLLTTLYVKETGTGNTGWVAK